MLTLHPNASETVECPRHEGDFVSATWELSAMGVASLAVRDDGSRATLTAGPAPGEIEVLVYSTWRTKEGDEVHEDTIKARIAGKPEAPPEPAPPPPVPRTSSMPDPEDGDR
jgi:hypothetical protein